jgi:hypothetical protein
MLHIVLRLLHRLSWSAVFGLVVLIATTIISIILHERLRILPDDDWPLYVWPIGCGLGWWFAWRTQLWRRFQYALVALGGAGALIFILLAIQFYERSQALTGVNGPFSGFGEGVSAAMCAILAATGLTILVGNSAILLDGQLQRV